MFPDMHWFSTNRGDRRALALYERHYSCYHYADGRKPNQRGQPGEDMWLMTSFCDALFIWQKSYYRRDGQNGVNCAVFRNESAILSSVLILEAEQLAWARWNGERLFTFVDAAKVHSRNPGYCFQKAGWHKCGKSKGGLLIYEKYPSHE